MLLSDLKGLSKCNFLGSTTEQFVRVSWIIWPHNPTFGYESQRTKMWNLKEILIFHTWSLTASFTIAKMFKQSKCSSKDEWTKRNMSWTYNGLLFKLKKETDFIAFFSMDEHQGHCAKWNKSQKDEVVSFHSHEVSEVVKFIETESKKMVSKC